MKNQISILSIIILMTLMYACKSDKVSTVASGDNIEVPIAQQRGVKSDTKAESTARSTDSKVSSSAAGGKKGNMKGGLPARTFMVKDGTVNTINAGMVIVQQRKHLVYGYMDLEEGKVKVYKLLDDKGSAMGYVTPRIGNTIVVGDITITSPKAMTEHRIRVGDTYGQLVEAAKNKEVITSIHEGKTYAKLDDLSYRLENAKVDSDTRIIEILIADKK